MSRKITLVQIQNIACQQAVNAFREVYGTEVEATKENMEKAPDILWDYLRADMLLRTKLKPDFTIKHEGIFQGRVCDGCRKEMMRFIDQYNLEGEENDERLLADGK